MVTYTDRTATVKTAKDRATIALETDTVIADILVRDFQFQLALLLQVTEITLVFAHDDVQ